MNLPSILLWGFLATLALSVVQSGSQALHLTRMSLPMMLGTCITGSWDRARAYGFLLHVGLGWAFSLVYAFVFESWGRTGWWLGALLGAAHGIFILVVLVPLLPAVHPRMATERRQGTPTPLLEPPGFLGLHYGSRTPIFTLVAHIVYGLILGSFYRLGG